MKRYPNTFSKRRASQSKHEFEKLLELFKERNVRNYLEIGAREGDSFHEIMINMPPGSRGIAVDLPGGLWGKNTTSDNLIKAVKDLMIKGYDVSYILGDSTQQSVISRIMDAGPFDAVFIDGDHTLDGVTKDWNNYKDLAPMIIFHDIVGTGESEKVFGNKVEVPVFWNQIKQEFSHEEFIDENSTMGIGVIFK